mmetsp:Transcript_9495/g.34545  ORF Transcript_9495/g.34545 Transcript_9495/m.34545 type:complete len:214 (+) Transcript_9495:2835-3476(+)
MPRNARLHLGGLGHILGLAREEHLVHAQVVRGDAADVRGDNVAGAELDEVAADDVAGLDPDLFSVADQRRDWRLKRGERLEGVVRVVLRLGRDRGVDEDDDRDRDGVDVRQELVLVVARGLDRRGRDDRAHEQVHDDGVELNEEQHEQGDARRLLELVRAVLEESFRGLRGGQALDLVRLHLSDDVIDVLLVDLELLGRGRHDAVRTFDDQGW